MTLKLVNLTINGRAHYAALKPNTTLLQALRDLGYTDVKSGCEKGDCGACTVLVDGTALNACLLLAWLAEHKSIVTVSGLGDAAHPHPLQQAFVNFGAAQCGYCIPGMIMAAHALLDQELNPTDDELSEALSGNLCRCTGYIRIFEAVRAAAAELGAQDAPAVGQEVAS